MYLMKHGTANCIIFVISIMCELWLHIDTVYADSLVWEIFQHLLELSCLSLTLNTGMYLMKHGKANSLLLVISIM